MHDHARALLDAVDALLDEADDTLDQYDDGATRAVISSSLIEPARKCAEMLSRALPSTRDAEIEALAERMFVADHHNMDAASIEEADATMSEYDWRAFWPWIEAEKFIKNRDAWRERRGEK